MSGTNSLLLAYDGANSDGGAGNYPNSTTIYYPPSGQVYLQLTNALGQEMPAATAVTVSNLGLRLSSTGFTSGQWSAASYVAGSPGNQSIALGGMSAGFYSDATHSDTVMAGQGFSTGSHSTTASPTFYSIVQMQGTTSLPGVLYGCSESYNSSLATSNTGYLPLLGANECSAFNATEDHSSQTSIGAAGTLSNFSINSKLTSNTITNTLRKNGANGSQTVTTSTTAGIYTDATHTDSVVSGDNCCTKIATGGGAVGAYSWSYWFAGSAAKHDLGAGWVTGNGSSGTPYALTASATYYSSFAGGNYYLGNITTTEVVSEDVLPYALTASALRCNIGSNTTQTLAVTSRVAAGAGNQSVSVGSGSTGVFSDATHTDTPAAGQAFDAKLAVGSGSAIGLSALTASFDDGSTSHSTETATATLALPGVSFNGSGSREESAAATLAIPGVEFNAGGARKETSGATLALRGVGFGADVGAAKSAEGTFAIGGVTIKAGVIDVGDVSDSTISFSTFGA